MTMVAAQASGVGSIPLRRAPRPVASSIAANPAFHPEPVVGVELVQGVDGVLAAPSCAAFVIAASSIPTIAKVIAPSSACRRRPGPGRRARGLGAEVGACLQPKKKAEKEIAARRTRRRLVLASIVLPVGERLGRPGLAGGIVPVQQDEADEEQESRQHSGER